MAVALRFFRFPGDDTKIPQSWIEADLSDLDIPGWGGTAVLSSHHIHLGALILRIKALTINNLKEDESGFFDVVFEHGRWNCSNPATFKVHKEAIIQVVDNMIALCNQNQKFSTWYLDALVDRFTLDLAVAHELEQSYVNYLQNFYYSRGGTGSAEKATMLREIAEDLLAGSRKDIKELEECIAQGKQPITNAILDKSLLLIKNGLKWSDALKIARTL